MILFSGVLLAQNGTIRGTVYDKSSGEPVLFTNVYVEELETGASTDVNGLYQIGPIPAGTYTVVITDVYGCTTTASATVTEPPVLYLDDVQFSYYNGYILMSIEYGNV